MAEVKEEENVDLYLQEYERQQQILNQQLDKDNTDT